MAKMERRVELGARKQRRMTPSVVCEKYNLLRFRLPCFQFSFKLSLSFRSGSRRAWLHDPLFR